MDDQQTRPEPNPKCKLFVGGLPWSMRGKELREHFEAAGEVVYSKVILDEQNRSRGFGFVEMGSEDAAAAAIEMFHKSDLEGRWLQVNIAEPRGSRD